MPLLSDYLRMDPARFVAAAYEDVLGRPADCRGYATSRRRLRAGLDRRQLLRELLSSDESAGHLGEEARQQRLAALPAPGPRPLTLAWRAARALREAVAPVAPPDAGLAEDVAALPPLAPSPPPSLPARLPPRGATPRGPAVVTIAAANYAPRVRVLLASLRRHAADCMAVVVLVDGPVQDGGLSDVAEVVDAAALGIPAFDDMTVRYDVLELSTAIKPFALHWLMERGHRQVVYLDPDTCLYAPMTEVFSLLAGGADAVVTPHALEPLPGPGEPQDHTFLRSGVYNLGFLALADTASTRRFTVWWGEQLRTRCLVSFAQNLFTDQRWCDLLPCYADEVAVLRHEGYNVAYWNVEHRPLSRDGAGRWRVGGAPLVMFHFSGLDLRRPETVSRYQTRLPGHVVQGLLPLLQDYADAVRREAPDAPSPLLCRFDELRPGVRMPALLRALYRQLWPAPRADSREVLVRELLDAALARTAATGSGGGGLPGLLVFMHAEQTDLQAAFRIDIAAERRDYADWFRLCAIEPLGLAPLRAASRR